MTAPSGMETFAHVAMHCAEIVKRLRSADDEEQDAAEVLLAFIGRDLRLDHLGTAGDAIVTLLTQACDSAQGDRRLYLIREAWALALVEQRRS